MVSIIKEDKLIKREWNDYWKNFSLKKTFFESIKRLYLSGKISSYINKLQGPQDKFILELGCGTTSVLKRLDGNRVGIDISRYPLKNSELFLINGDIKRLPFMDSTFDIVYSVGTLEHLNNIDEYFLEIKRIMKEDGVHINIQDKMNNKVIIRLLDLFYSIKMIPEVWIVDKMNLERLRKFVKFEEDLPGSLGIYTCQFLK